MSVGFRVVRGPDWIHGNADNGEGHMGTVIAEKRDKTCDVIWDMGGRTTGCRLGKDGKHDLRILDNAPAGVTFEYVTCDGECGSNKALTGMRWKCNTCDDFDLCTQCYVTKRHNLLHAFTRFDTPNSPGVEVPIRGSSKKIWALGIFPGAKVARGAHWSYGDQDGGKGSKGEVLDIRSFGTEAGGRNAVKVKWQTGESNVYRLGSTGKVEVKCVNEARGFEYYVDHLPFAASGGNSVSVAQSTSIKIGDKVCVDIPPASLKELQRGRGGWSMRMNDCIGEPMTVKGFPNNSTVEVEHEGQRWHFYIGACRKVPDLKVNDVVRVITDEKKVQLLQERRGGWNDEMSETLGKVGRIVKIDSDGDVAVAFGLQTWVYNAACLTPAPGAKIDEMEEQDFTQSQSGSAADNLSDGLTRLMAHLIVLDALSHRADFGPQEMISACAKGDLEAVQGMVEQNKELVNQAFKDLTPLMVASNEGHFDIVKLLVNNGARINVKNSEDLTALLLAISGKQEHIADYLLSKGADADVASTKGRSAAHVAAYEGLIKTLELVLKKGCKPNRQDCDGDTPLHDAIFKTNTAAVNVMLRHESLDLTIANNRGFRPIHWAAFKGHYGAVQRLIAKDPSVVKQVRASGGNTALHIAAVNNHMDIAKFLLEKGKADVNAQNLPKQTPLHLAAHEGYFEMTKLLLIYRANMAAQDCEGDTPLHVALMSERISGGDTNAVLTLFGLGGRIQMDEDNERFKTAAIMVENKASLNMKNKKGKKPLEVCKSQNVKDAINKFSDKVRPESTRRARQPEVSPEELLAGLFTELITMNCSICETRPSNARLQPCGHKVTCQQCSMGCDECPLCNTEVTKRTDLQGNEIMEVPCRVQ